MSNKTLVKPSLEAAIEFWGAADWRTAKPAEAPKLKLVDIHPSKSLVIAADRDGKLMVWDYELRSTLVNTTIVSLLSDATFVDERAIPSVAVSKNLRLNPRSALRMTGSHTETPTKLRNDAPSRKETAIAPAVFNKVKQQIGHILQVCFGDMSYRLASAGAPALGRGFAHRSSSSTLIAVVCEAVIIFHDYVTCEVTALTANELGKATPTSVEFAGASLCLIGCSDGTIRVWDMAHSSGANQRRASVASGLGTAPVPSGGIVLTLNTHSKSEVAVIKSIPIKKVCEGSDTEGPKLRFVSVGGDGQSLIWEIPATPSSSSSGAATSDPMLPLARIKESLGSGIAREDLTFDAENNTLLVCLNERKIRFWDLEDLSAMSAIAGGGHLRGGSGGAVSASTHGSVSASAHGGGFLGSSTHGSAGGLTSKGIRTGLGLAKRGTIASLITGGADPLSTVFSLRSVGAVCPEKALAGSYGKIASFGLVQHPYFAAGCYVLSNKGNAFCLLQDKGSGGNDEVSSNESASVAGATDKAAPLSLVQEFSLKALMERYFAMHAAATDTTLLPSPSDALRAEALDAAAKVYSVRPHRAAPHLFTVVSSVGVLVISLGPRLPGPLCATHPLWGAVKMIHGGDGTVQKITCAMPLSEAPVGQGLEISPEVLEDCGMLEHGVSGSGRLSMGSSANFKRRQSSKRSTHGGASAMDHVRSSSRPVFHTSPSGKYCAVHWPESMVYVVLCTNIQNASARNDGFATGAAAASTSESAVEVERGHCLDFAWVGTDDSYLIKTPAEITSMGVNAKPKRSSVSSLLFGAQKELSFLISPQLLLKQCVASDGTPGREGIKVVDHPLHLSHFGAAKGASNTTPLIQPGLVTGMFGGPVLNMNTLNAKESEALMTAAAQAKRAHDAAAAAAIAADPKRSGPAGMPPPPSNDAEDEGPRVVDDVEATVRELKANHPPPPSKQVSTFFTVVSGKWIRLRQAQEAAAAANALAAKDKGKKGRRASTVGGSTTEQGEEVADVAGDAALQFVAVGASMQHAEMVRWDYARSLCALMQTGSSAVSILRLRVEPLSAEDHGYAQMTLQPLCAVDVCFPGPLRSPLYGLTWCDGALFTTTFSCATMKVTFITGADSTVTGEEGTDVTPYSDTFELPVCSPYSWDSSLAGGNNAFDCTPRSAVLVTSEALGLHQGAVFTCARDGSICAVPTAANPALAAALTHETSVGLTSAEQEAAGVLALHRGEEVHTQRWAYDRCAEETKLRSLLSQQ